MSRSRSAGSRRVALDDVAEYLVDALQQLRLQPDPGGGRVVADLLRPARTDDRGGDVRVLEHPGDRELSHRQVDMIGAQPPQRPVDRLQQVLAASPRSLGPGPVGQ